MENQEQQTRAQEVWDKFLRGELWGQIHIEQVPIIAQRFEPQTLNDGTLTVGVDTLLPTGIKDKNKDWLEQALAAYPQEGFSHIEWVPWETGRLDELAIELPPAELSILECMPQTISRPLALIDGTAYAASWVWGESRSDYTRNKKDEIIKHPVPLRETKQILVVIRDDGRAHSEQPYKTEDGADWCPLAMGDMPGVHLPEIPPASKLWSGQGVKRYIAGERPDRVDVFNRVVSVVDRFIDFDRSLADQETMCQMVALYVMGTYFLPAFSVVGYLWPNGERGSGKTILLNTVAEMAYLGIVIQAGASFASLRDLADYGATLGFDDAEDIMDRKRSDPDKRTLLLAGNRKGNYVPLKEATGDKTWRNRYVNTFCPRLFSAIKLPDNVLGSRTIVVPLVRTLDRYKANADPVKYKLWPCDRQQLVDDLWALALAHLPELEDADEKVAEKAALVGRSLEPWRTILAMADWLGEELFEKMNELSVSYQEEKPELELADLTILVVKALIALDTWDTKDTKDTKGERALFLEHTTSAIRDSAREVAEDEELWFTEDYLTSDRVGRVLRRLRLESVRRAAGTTKRGWRYTTKDLEYLAATYNVPLCPSAQSAQSVLSVQGGTPDDLNAQNALNAQEEHKAAHISESGIVVPVYFADEEDKSGAVL